VNLEIKTMRKIIAIIFAVFASSCSLFAGPFGFDYGKTESQIIAQVGKSHIVRQTKGEVSFNTAPKPYGLFDLYALTFFPSGKLRGVFAMQSGVVLKSPEEMRALFSKVKDNVALIYEDPSLFVDCTVPQVTDGKKEMCTEWGHGRDSLFAGWNTGDSLESSHLESIFLRILRNSNDPETAGIDISYSFEGDSEASKEEQRKQSPF
jgi:hypothetical protein